MGVTAGYELWTGATGAGSTGAGAAGVGVTGVGEMGSGAAAGVLLGVIGSTAVGVSCVLSGRALVGAVATVGVTVSETCSSLFAADFFSGMTAVIKMAPTKRAIVPTANVAGRTRRFPRALVPLAFWRCVVRTVRALPFSLAFPKSSRASCACSSITASLIRRASVASCAETCARNVVNSGLSGSTSFRSGSRVWSWRSRSAR